MPIPPFEKILTRNFDVPGYTGSLADYVRQGGYQALPKGLREFQPADLIELVKQSGLRGRGGAGFPAGMKWGFVPKDPGLTKYLCCNADESEPGTFKDRELIERDPHQLIEGIVLASYAVGVRTAYVYIRGEFLEGYRILARALEEAYARGYVGRNILGSGYDLDIVIHRGAGAYICGEETGLLESLEGKKGQPRLKPPFPAVKGLYGCPTVVNNVETLCNVPHIVLRGAAWFASIGVPKGTGTRLFSISGHVNRPANYELPLGLPLRVMIEEVAGGVRDGRPLKAVIPGGSSSPIFTPAHLDVSMDFDSVAAAGSMAGSGGVIVLDDTTCIVRVGMVVNRFYDHESCGQCTQCREGTAWLHKMFRRLEAGQGRAEDLDIIADVCGNMKGQTICPLSDAAAMPTESYVKHFREEFERHIREHRCPLPA